MYAFLTGLQLAAKPSLTSLTDDLRRTGNVQGSNAEPNVPSHTALNDWVCFVASGACLLRESISVRTRWNDRWIGTT